MNDLRAEGKKGLVELYLRHMGKMSPSERKQREAFIKELLETPLADVLALSTNFNEPDFRRCAHHALTMMVAIVEDFTEKYPLDYDPDVTTHQE